MIFREVLSRGAPRDIPNKEGDLPIDDTARWLNLDYVRTLVDNLWCQPRRQGKLG